MLKNHKLVHRLTLDQKINLVLSNKLYCSSSVEGYTFPSFELKETPIEGQNNFKSTIYPSNKALSQTWNRKLIEKIARYEGEENNIFSKNPIFKFNGVLDRNNVTDDPYLNGDFIFHYLKGLETSLASSCYEVVESSNQTPVKEEIDEFTDRAVLSKNNMDFILVSKVSEMADIKHVYGTKKVFFAKPERKEEIVKFINSGVYVNYFTGNYDDAVAYIKQAVDLGENITGKLNDKLMSKNDYDVLLDTGAALPLKNLDDACDNYITLLLKLDQDHKKSVAENKYISSVNDLPYDYKKNNDEALEAARESIVMLKNNYGVLPVSPKQKVAVIGDACDNYDYYQESFNGRIPSIFKTPYSIIHNYLELDTSEYAHGYAKGAEHDDALLETAKELVKKSDVVLYYMWADEKEHKIPDNQLDVLKQIYECKDIPIVAIVHAAEPIEMSFEKYCAAILLVGEAGQTISEAVLDIVSGSFNPSGKLTSDIPLVPGDEYVKDGEPTYSNKDYAKKYAFGYGLSYSNFVYKHLDVSSSGASVTITNISKFDGTEVVELYIRKKKSSTTLKRMQLRGYAKVNINSGETVKVSIPFDEETFKCYMKDKKCFGIEGGEYEILVGTSSDNIKLEGKLTLSKYIDTNYAYNESEVVNKAKTKNEFESLLTKAKEMHCGLRVVISLLLFFWISAVLFVIWLFGAYKSPEGYLSDQFLTITLYLMIVAILGLFIAMVIYLTKSFKKRNKLIAEYKASDVSLANVVEVMKDFDTTKKVVYQVEEPAPETVVTEEPTTEEEIANTETEPVEEQYSSEVPDMENAEVPELTEEDIPLDSLTEETAMETEEVNLEVEKEPEEEVIVDIESAVLSDDEIRAQEAEEIRLMEEQQSKEETPENFDEYEESVTFDDSQSLSQVCDRFMQYAEERGLILELSSVRSLLSNLGSTHIIFVNSKLKDLLDQFLIIFNEFLGNKSHINEASDQWLSSFSLSWYKDENGNYQKTDFVNDVYNACRFKNNLNTVILKNVSMSNIDSYLNEFIDFSNNPSYDHYMKLNTSSRLRIPQNLTLLLTPSSDDYEESMSKELSTASASIELIMRTNENVPEEVNKPDSLSYSYLNDLIYEAKKTCFLSEDNWKRIDNFEEEVNNTEEFRVSNKLVLSIERYSSVFIDCGGDEVDALDSILAEKIVPVIKTLNSFRQENGIKVYTALLEKHFGEENIPKAKRALQSSLHQEY